MYTTLSKFLYRPISSLKWGHFVRSGGFLYPEEKLVRGSRNMFAALLIKCSERSVAAVCSYKPREASAPSFVALVPQEEKRDPVRNKKRICSRIGGIDKIIE